MEGSSLSVALPQLLRHRNSVPDVPQDVDYFMQHLNDPNWEYQSASTEVGDSFELDTKRDAFSSGHSIRSSDLETDSQADSTFRSGSSKAHLREAYDDYDDESPYPEVRAAVSSVDDSLTPVNTFRTWFLGIILCTFLSGMNHLFIERYPSVAISPLVIQLVALPMGKGLEWLLPKKQFNTFGYVWSFNPGPFNIKEHTVITVMASTVYNDVYVTTVFVTQKVFYGQTLSFAYEILISLSTQLFGFALAGMTRQFLVWPASMIWPGSLVSCALLNTLHKNFGKIDRRHISRERFFLFVMLGSAAWYFLPGYLFTALSMFNWVCWIAPQNATVNSLFGYSTGLGMGFVTFDWAVISWIGSPLVTPWWAEANIFAGFVFFIWFITPILYFKNVFFAQYMPILTGSSFDNTGNPYNVNAILTDGIFDEAKYQAYSPMFISIGFLMSYGVQFATLTSVIVHTFLWYRHDLIRQIRRTVNDERDVHSRLMSAYREVPWFWYAGIGVFAFVCGVIGIEIYPTQLPVWGLVVALLLSTLFLIPVGMIRAITNQVIPLNVLSEIVVGYMIPGKPVAMMLFKTYGYITVVQSLTFTSDLKIGHYMKIPPRIMFIAQCLAAVIAAFVCVGVQAWEFANIEDFCTPHQKDGWKCLDVNTFATASIIYGEIGPRRMFSSGALYNPMMYFFVIGAVMPIPFYILACKYPQSLWRYVNIPVFFAGLGQLPPATGIMYSSAAMIGAFFQWFMRRFHFRWWMRYNYILSAALDSGVAIGLVLIFFCLQFPKGGVSVNWWGNTVWQNTYDSLGVPMKVTNTSFGPSTWS
ncbi:OPT oligopeptide transporter [Amylocystis lapponica]|nr:OPT oligopeptide transporter [Amylocystis lapponica]